jgi:hypothetical protein
MFCCVVPRESTTSCMVVSRIASRSTSFTRSGWRPFKHRIAALAPTSTLIVFSSSRIGCVCVHLPLDERDEEALSPGTRPVELGDSQTGCLL